MAVKDPIVTELRGIPLPPSSTRRRLDEGGLPERPGFYAWWVVPGGLPGVPYHPHPNRKADLGLLYVGIAPNSATSQQTLRSRVLKNHLGGNTGSSTFRFSLAALLFEQEGFHPTTTQIKFVLPRQDNRRLSEWQQGNLSLTWCAQLEPWKGMLEAEVIAEMQPPMNLAENSDHPFHATMSDARRRFREAARRDAGRK